MQTHHGLAFSKQNEHVSTSGESGPVAHCFCPVCSLPHVLLQVPGSQLLPVPYVLGVYNSPYTR